MCKDRLVAYFYPFARPTRISGAGFYFFLAVMFTRGCEVGTKIVSVIYCWMTWQQRQLKLKPALIQHPERGSYTFSAVVMILVRVCPS